MKIPKAYREVFETQDKLYDEIVQSHVLRLKEIDQMLPPSSIFLFLTNTMTYTYEYISQNFERVAGHSKEDLYKNGIAYFLTLVHPDDIQIWLQVLKELMEFCMTQIKTDDRKRLNFQYNYRLKTRNGGYINLIESQIPLHLDQNGKPVIGLGHFTAFGNGEPQSIRASAKLLNYNDEYETVFFKNFSSQLWIDHLSNRERDVLRMLALNKTSKQIADSLFLSCHTVDTHRRNIIKKLNLTSTSEIVAYCRLNGFF